MAPACACGSRCHKWRDCRQALVGVAAGVALALIAACQSNPGDPAGGSAPAQCRDLLLGSLADYTRALQLQDDATLMAERAMLEQAPPSADRDLKLALLLSQPSSATYDPGRAADLLQTLVSASDAGSAYGALATTLSVTLQGGAQNCAASKQVRELTAQLDVEHQKRQETAARLESARQELANERAQRARLEQQLEALKSLEEQIQNRENGAGR